MRQAADKIEHLKLRNTELNKKVKTFEILRIKELHHPAIGHDYWKNYYEAKLMAELEAANEELTGRAHT